MIELLAWVSIVGLIGVFIQWMDRDNRTLDDYWRDVQEVTRGQEEN